MSTAENANSEPAWPLGGAWGLDTGMKGMWDKATPEDYPCLAYRIDRHVALETLKSLNRARRKARRPLEVSVTDRVGPGS